MKYESSLYHHGIPKMRWGQRNGPPYPLSRSQKSSAEKRAEGDNSLDKEKNTAYNNDKRGLSLTDNQKKAIKIGATVAAAALVTYGGYKLAKSGKLDALASIGRSKVDELLSKKAGNADSIAKSINGINKLASSESLSDTIKKANPHFGDVNYKNNCSACGIAGFLRRKGFDVTAKSTNGKMQNMGGVVEECFKNAKVFDGSAVKFGRSRKDAAEMLVKRFGNDAEGICSVQLKGGGGHIFNWSIKDSIVSFYDAQQGLNDEQISNSYWKIINPQGFLQLARLDDLEMDFDAIKRFVE